MSKPLTRERLIVANDILLSEVAALLAEGRESELLTRGDSMRPFILGDRDSVVLRKTDRLKPGDIALARLADGRWVLHRIVSIGNGNVTLKGDGNLTGTECCLETDIAGIAIEVLKPHRRVDCRSEKALRRARWWNALSVAQRRRRLRLLKAFRWSDLSAFIKRKIQNIKTGKLN